MITPARAADGRGAVGVPVPGLAGFGVAVATTTTAALLSILFRDFLQTDVHLFFFPAIVFVAWCTGFGPSLLAIGLTVLGVGLLFLQPAGGAGLPLGRDLVGAGLFLPIAGVLAWLIDRLRAAQRQAEMNAEAAARVSEMRRQLAAIVESSDDAITGKTLDGVITSWNRAAERIYGYTAAEVIGRPITVLVRPGEEEELLAILERLRQGERFERHLTTRVGKDGVARTMALTISPIRGDDGLIVGSSTIARDVTEEIERQKGIEEANALLEELNAELEQQMEEAQVLTEELRQMNDELLITQDALKSKALRMTALNTLTAALARAVSLEEVSQALLCEGARVVGAESGVIVTLDEERASLAIRSVAGVPEERLPHWRCAAAAAFEATPTLDVLRTGAPLYLEAAERATLDPQLAEAFDEVGMVAGAFLPLLAGGDAFGVVVLAFAEDHAFPESERSMLATIAQAGAQALERARLYEAERRASRAKSQFLAVMSHELRTPLNAILGYQDLLDAEIVGPLNATQKVHVERIGVSSRHLLQLIDQILSLSRIEAGKETVRPEVTEVCELARNVGELVRPLAEKRGIALRIQLPAGPTPLETDPGRLRQILFNLLSNAVKFTEQGEVELRVRADNGSIAFEVRDTGIGIAAEDLKLIFEPFLQVEASGGRNRSGTGLGLAVSQHLAQLLGAELTVESRPGAGSKFTVGFPAAVAH